MRASVVEDNTNSNSNDAAVSNEHPDSSPQGDRSNDTPGQQEAEPTAQQGTQWLGIVVGKQLDGEFAEVTRVMPGSPAEKAGLKPGDRLESIAGEKVNSPEAVRAAVLAHEPGDRIEIGIVRDGTSQTIEAKLARLEPDAGLAIESDSSRALPAWLGVQLAPGRSAIGRGVIITKVFPGSPADQVGLQAGDAILQVNESRVEAAADLQVEIAGRRPGELVTLTVRRDGQRRTFRPQLGAFALRGEDVSLLTRGEARQLLRELLAGPFGLADEVDHRVPQQDGTAPSWTDEVSLPTFGKAELVATQGHDVTGEITLQQRNDGLHLTGEIHNLQPGLHGFHIHQYGDLSDPTGKAAGGHFNPTGVDHGGPDAATHHAGDLGNVEADDNGVAHVDIIAPWLKLHYVIGRSFVVHGGEDDLTSQPSGDAGPRVAVGVIGIANPM